MALFGVPVIKEDKAIALRAIDIGFFLVSCAMQWTQVLNRNKGEFPGNGGSKMGQKWVKNGGVLRVWAVQKWGPFIGYIYKLGERVPNLIV